MKRGIRNRQSIDRILATCFPEPLLPAQAPSSDTDFISLLYGVWRPFHTVLTQASAEQLPEITLRLLDLLLEYHLPFEGSREAVLLADFGK